jgi:hypothetical protein
MIKGWYILKKRGKGTAHFFNSKGRSRCGNRKILDENFRPEDEKTNRCEKCKMLLYAYGEVDDRE